jgi:hypothetical protein
MNGGNSALDSKVFWAAYVGVAQNPSVGFQTPVEINSGESLGIFCPTFMGNPNQAKYIELLCLVHGYEE